MGSVYKPGLREVSSISALMISTTSFPLAALRTISKASPASKQQLRFWVQFRGKGRRASRCFGRPGEGARGTALCWSRGFEIEKVGVYGLGGFLLASPGF